MMWFVTNLKFSLSLLLWDTFQWYYLVSEAKNGANEYVFKENVTFHKISADWVKNV